MKVAEFIGGLVLLLSAILVGARLTRDVIREKNSTRVLVLDLMLVGVIILGLAGITVLMLPFTD